MVILSREFIFCMKTYIFPFSIFNFLNSVDAVRVWQWLFGLSFFTASLTLCWFVFFESLNVQGHSVLSCRFFVIFHLFMLRKELILASIDNVM